MAARHWSDQQEASQLVSAHVRGGVDVRASAPLRIVRPRRNKPSIASRGRHGRRGASRVSGASGGCGAAPAPDKAGKDGRGSRRGSGEHPPGRDRLQGQQASEPGRSRRCVPGPSPRRITTQRIGPRKSLQPPCDVHLPAPVGTTGAPQSPSLPIVNPMIRSGCGQGIAIADQVCRQSTSAGPMIGSCFGHDLMSILEVRTTSSQAPLQCQRMSLG